MNIIEELSKRRLGALDEMLEEYQSVDRELAKREFEIRYPWHESDENIGGGKSAMDADGAYRTLQAIESDPRMIYLRRLKNACAATVSCLTDSQLEVYKIRYQGDVRLGWADLPEIVHKSRSGVYAIRYSILECLAKKVGYLP